tara:strand:- start:15439 stop:15843 length:405 start_codon:yes stop_codon:yes gene_type:complete
MSWKDILKDSARYEECSVCGGKPSGGNCRTCNGRGIKTEKKSVGTIARLGAAAITGDDEEKSGSNCEPDKEDVEKLYGTHRQGTSDVADSMRDMVEQLQEIEEMGAMSASISPEVQRAFNEATQALGKLQTLLA